MVPSSSRKRDSDCAAVMAKSLWYLSQYYQFSWRNTSLVTALSVNTFGATLENKMSALLWQVLATWMHQLKAWIQVSASIARPFTVLTVYSPPPKGVCKVYSSVFPGFSRRAAAGSRKNHSSLKLNIIQNFTEWFRENNDLVYELKISFKSGAMKSAKLWLERTRRHQESMQGVSMHLQLRKLPSIWTMNLQVQETLCWDYGRLKRINELHPSYDSFQYPIIFPYETNGYHIYLKSRSPSRQGARKVSQTKYYSYHLMVRDCDSHIFHMWRLLQQFLVDV